MVSTVTVQGGSGKYFRGLRKRGVCPHSVFHIPQAPTVIANLITTALFVLVGILLVRFWPQISGAVNRFDAQVRERRAQEIRDRSDATAHFRHTLKLAEEQVDVVSSITVPDERTGQPVIRFLFEGETFASEEDAKCVREDKVRSIARRFYMDLPAALRARKGDDQLGAA